jgi:hypothetical protein
MEELKETVSTGVQGKRTKQLWNAFEVAAEEHDLAYFKDMLLDHERRVIQERQEQEDKEAKKLEQSAKKASRKSLPAATEDGDQDDTTADAAPKKSAKKPKRKAETDDDTLKVRIARGSKQKIITNMCSPLRSRRSRLKLQRLLLRTRLQPNRKSPRRLKLKSQSLLKAVRNQLLLKRKNLFSRPLRNWRRSRRPVSCAI